MKSVANYTRTAKGLHWLIALLMLGLLGLGFYMHDLPPVSAEAATLKRSEFNAGKYAPNVGDDVTITIAIEAIKG